MKANRGNFNERRERSRSPRRERSRSPRRESKRNRSRSPRRNESRSRENHQGRDWRAKDFPKFEVRHQYHSGKSYPNRGQSNWTPPRFRGITASMGLWDVPTFSSKADCDAFVREEKRKPSNPKHRQMRQLVSVLVDEQIEEMLGPYWNDMRSKMRQNLQEKLSLSTLSRESHEPPPIVPPSWLPTILVERIRDRLNLPIHRQYTSRDVENTLKYLADHMRCGIYVAYEGGELKYFVPFVKTDYTNNWHEHIRFPEEAPTIEEYYQLKARVCMTVGAKPETLDEIIDMPKWWSNAYIICNIPSRDLWGDHYMMQLKHMLITVGRERTVPDCEFFINKRDHPQLKKDLTEPYGFLFDSEEEPLTRERYEQYAPILSPFISEAFADIPAPSSDDWEAVTGLVFPPRGGDIYAEENVQKFYVPWEERIPTAFFRGSATGGGTSHENNQRLRASWLSHVWKSDDRYNQNNHIDGVPYLNAGVVKWNLRDKKQLGECMTFCRPDLLDFPTADYVPMYEQCRYKYILYAEGHTFSPRYTFLLKMGWLILKVESTNRINEAWYTPLLEAWKDYVPVAADLSDLAEKIEWCKNNDAECKIIAENAKKFYDLYLSKDHLLDYMEFVLQEIGSRYRVEL